MAVQISSQMQNSQNSHWAKSGKYDGPISLSIFWPNTLDIEHIVKGTVNEATPKHQAEVQVLCNNQ